MPTLKIQNQIKFKMNFAVLVQKKSSSSVGCAQVTSLVDYLLEGHFYWWHTHSRSYAQGLRIVMVWFYPYLSGFVHRHWGNHTIAPVPVKQPWKTWVNGSFESPNNCQFNLDQTKHNQTWLYSMECSQYAALQSITNPACPMGPREPCC